MSMKDINIVILCLVINAYILESLEVRYHPGCLQTSSGAEYIGTINITENNNHCISWNRDNENIKAGTMSNVQLNDNLFPDGSIKEAQSYCRNPGGIRMKPWCYVEGVVRWQYCNIPDCGCKTTVLGETYIGALDITRSGYRCQNWDSQQPHIHRFNNYTSTLYGSFYLKKNYCRNPSPSDSGGPWCYTQEPNTRWESCDVVDCECRQGAAPNSLYSYRGRISQTPGGHACLRWDNINITKYVNLNISILTIKTLLESANYCRNPSDNSSEMPWCFINQALDWEYCQIPLCTSLTDSQLTATVTTRGTIIKTMFFTKGSMDNKTITESLQEDRPDLAMYIVSLYSLIVIITGILITTSVIIYVGYKRTTDKYAMRMRKQLTKQIDNTLYQLQSDIDNCNNSQLETEMENFLLKSVTQGEVVEDKMVWKSEHFMETLL